MPVADEQNVSVVVCSPCAWAIRTLRSHSQIDRHDFFGVDIIKRQQVFSCLLRYTDDELSPLTVLLLSQVWIGLKKFRESLWNHIIYRNYMALIAHIDQAARVVKRRMDNITAY